MTVIDEAPGSQVTPEVIAARRARPEPTDQILFKVAGVWGVSDAAGMRMPLNDREFIESGQVAITSDPDAPANSNVGLIRYDECSVRIRYGVQVVFPGLYDLVTGGRYDKSLLAPIHAVATDTCEVLPDFSGWRALGTLDFLPGSLWAGAAGG